MLVQPVSPASRSAVGFLGSLGAAAASRGRVVGEDITTSTSGAAVVAMVAVGGGGSGTTVIAAAGARADPAVLLGTPVAGEVLLAGREALTCYAVVLSTSLKGGVSSCQAVVDAFVAATTGVLLIVLTTTILAGV